jgi:hypothetical protein
MVGARLSGMRALLLWFAAACLVYGQAPRIGVLDFYGLHKTSESKLRKALGIREGDTLPGSKSGLEDKLEKVPGIVRAHIEAVCCQDRAAILYVGIEEKGAPHFEFHDEPAGAESLPESVVQGYRSFLTAFENAVRRGQADESIIEGHALAKDAAARSVQESFPDLADKNLEAIRKVLRDSADPEQRATAAYVIAYVHKKRLVVDDLQYAMQDPDEGVRANAIRSLGAIAALGQKDPGLEIRVVLTWFVEMLNSISWSDRIRAAEALVPLTESREEHVMVQLRDRAVDSLVEMAQWKDLKRALPAFLLLGRVAGVPEAQIHKAWEGDRAQGVLGFLRAMGIKGK